MPSCVHSRAFGLPLHAEAWGARGSPAVSSRAELHAPPRDERRAELTAPLPPSANNPSGSFFLFFVFLSVRLAWLPLLSARLSFPSSAGGLCVEGGLSFLGCAVTLDAVPVPAGERAGIAAWSLWSPAPPYSRIARNHILRTEEEIFWPEGVFEVFVDVVALLRHAGAACLAFGLTGFRSNGFL